jgi:hypothetical protein
MAAPAVSAEPQKGYYEVNRGEFLTVYVKRGYLLIPCKGEAHTNGHVGNCGLCLDGPWGWVAVKS